MSQGGGRSRDRQVCQRHRRCRAALSCLRSDVPERGQFLPGHVFLGLLCHPGLRPFVLGLVLAPSNLDLARGDRSAGTT